jgi:hypothetical protein
MVESVRSFTDGKGSNFFLFADQEVLTGASPLQMNWVTGKGESVRLTD